MTRTAKHRAATTSRRPALLAAVIAALTVAVFGNLAPATSASLDDPAAIRQACMQRLADPRPMPTSARNWLRNCRDAFAPPSATPTPSASGTPTPTPTASPSGSPSASQSPTPSPTATPSPSQSPTASPSASPTPSPTATPVGGCMPTPSLCGYPDSTNTGVPRMIVLTPSAGDLHITTPGTYTGLDITGCVYIEASNVTITNSRISGNCWFSIRTTHLSGQWTNLLIQDTEIVLSPTLDGSYAICCSEYTLDRVWMHAPNNRTFGGKGIYLNTNVIVRNSFIEIGLAPSNTPTHMDGMISSGGSNVLIEHNTVRNPNAQTSDILLSTNDGPISNVTVRNNLLAGGGYCAYCGTAAGPVTGTFSFTGNRFSRIYYSGGGSFGPVAYCEGRLGTGNVWDETGAPIAGAN